MQDSAFETVAEKYSSSDVSIILFTDERYLQWSHRKKTDLPTVYALAAAKKKEVQLTNKTSD